MLYKIKDIITRLKRGCKWFLRGYNTYEWDYNYLLEIMRFKLQDMLTFWDNIDNTNVIESSRLRNVKNLKICVHLLHRMIEDDYISNASIECEERWGKLQIIYGKEDKRGLTPITITPKLVKTEQDDEQARKDRDRAHKKAKLIKKYDQELFFKIFSKHYEYWWD